MGHHFELENCRTLENFKFAGKIFSFMMIFITFSQNIYLTALFEKYYD